MKKDKNKLNLSIKDQFPLIASKNSRNKHKPTIWVINLTDDCVIIQTNNLYFKGKNMR